MNILERLSHLTADLNNLFATDPLGAIIRCHQIGREARERALWLETASDNYAGTPEGEARDNELRSLRYYIGFGS